VLQASGTVLALPLALPSFTISLCWHQRHSADPEHSFLRAAIVRATRSKS